jgi:hypothetical protein
LTIDDGFGQCPIQNDSRLKTPISPESCSAFNDAASTSNILQRCSPDLTDWGFPHASPVNVATGHFEHDKVSASIFQAASAIPLRLQAF